MFNWEKLELFGIEKADKDSIKTNDGIHCSICAEHLTDHGVKDGVLLHPLDIANIINKE
jgi:hypothetical protein